MRRKSVTDMEISRDSAVQTDAAYFGLRLKVLVSVFDRSNGWQK